MQARLHKLLHPDTHEHTHIQHVHANSIKPEERATLRCAFESGSVRGVTMRVTVGNESSYTAKTRPQKQPSFIKGYGMNKTTFLKLMENRGGGARASFELT